MSAPSTATIPRQGEPDSQISTVVTAAVTDVIAELKRKNILHYEDMQRIVSKGDEMSTQVKGFLRVLFTKLAENITGHLKLIPGSQTITLNKTDGKAIIGTATNVFTGHIDPDFNNFGCNIAGLPTGPQDVQVHVLIKDGDFRSIYGKMKRSLDGMCLSQGQIIQFVQEHCNFLSGEGTTVSFLFKVGRLFLVARVSIFNAKLDVDVLKLTHDYIWSKRMDNYFVLPKPPLLEVT